jgi:diketogulonate reductase-like aldo/keto reductase
MKVVPLPSDPLVFGFWKVAKDSCADICYKAIKAGYRRLDCACDYGNEKEVGEGIAKVGTKYLLLLRNSHERINEL